MPIDVQTVEPDTAAIAARVLIVDDERSMRELLSIVLRRDGYEVVTAEDGAAAVALLKKQRFDILITDIRMPQMNGVDLLREAKGIAPDLVSIVMTAFASTDTAVEALRLGAADYVHKSPNAASELRLRVGRELERRRLQQENVLLKRALGQSNQFSNIIGTSSAMVAVFQLVETIAPTNSTVLITGESGTGKELVARAIHAASPRAARPFVAVDCGAIAEGVLESELFGHARGAFTGAQAMRRGLFEEANQGTLFLDEIGDVGQNLQARLLRALQEGTIRRVGTNETIAVDVRVVAASNRDLAQAVKDGRFREDLFYRLNVVTIVIPPLRERREDIPLLAEHFAAKHGRAEGAAISVPARDLLVAYDWPGNVRELENVVARALALNPSGVVTPEDLVDHVRSARPAAAALAALAGVTQERPTLAELEKRYAAQVLQETGGNKTRAAEILGIDRKTLYRLLGDAEKEER